jgi:hypothetical protein
MSLIKQAIVVRQIAEVQRPRIHTSMRREPSYDHAPRRRRHVREAQFDTETWAEYVDASSVGTMFWLCGFDFVLALGLNRWRGLTQFIQHLLIRHRQRRFENGNLENWF